MLFRSRIVTFLVFEYKQICLYFMTKMLKKVLSYASNCNIIPDHLYSRHKIYEGLKGKLVHAH